MLPLEGLPGVDQVLPLRKPYKWVSREFLQRDSVIDVLGRKIGGGAFSLMAGPCSVESLEQTLEAARACKAAGVSILRGGAFKPRSSPYAFQGLGTQALEILAEVARPDRAAGRHRADGRPRPRGRATSTST